MEKRALQIVSNYITDHLDKSDQKAEFDVFTVWKCKA